MPKPVKRVQDARTRQGTFAAMVKQFPDRLKVLTEGDSWFSYPLNNNIADYIELMSTDVAMLRLEHNGDEARDILASNSDEFKNLKAYLKKYPVDALLLSAGGNDLVAGELKRLLDKKVNGATWQTTVKLAYLTQVLDDIVAAYSRLLDARDAVRPGCVVFAHSYCYFQPTGRKATGPFGLLKSGPWMRPVLVAKGLDPDTEGRDFARYLVDELHARLRALAAARPKFHVVDMRSALPVDDVHWSDEIHPSGTGFKRLADDFWRPALRAQFPGRGFD
jgi:GDSL-like Lipase/Acylhydrolase family